MSKYQPEPIAIVGLAAIMPDAPDATAFWENIKTGRYSISDVPPDRWDSDLYYDADRNAPDKTYSRIGGWVCGPEAGQWEPCESRGSRTVLREPRGETPLGYSPLPICFDTVC